MKTLFQVSILELKAKIKDALTSFPYIKRAYLFGSVLDNKITGSSDIDILVIVDNKDPKEAYIEIAMELEDILGEEAYLVDLHVVTKEQTDIPVIANIISKANQLLP